MKLGLDLYLQAFFDLDSERTHSFSLNPIPWSSIKDYANAFEFDDLQTEDLFYLIRELDSKHLSRLQSKQSKQK